jgi:predicted RNA-binding protein with RPS1 domain
MTDQERRGEVAEPELLNELIGAAKTAEQQAAASPAETEPVAQQEPTTDAEAPAETDEAEQLQEQAVGADAAKPAEAETAATDESAPEPATAEAAATDESAPEPATAEAAATDEATTDLAPIEVPLITRVVPAEAQAEAAAAEIPNAETSEAAGEGASYTPVAEDDGKPRRLKDLEAGMELEGRVTSIALYGIFVDVGVGRDGLVHISEMSDTRIDSPSDLVQIGDTVKVRVKSIDPDARRISLTMRTPRERGDGGSRSRSRGPRRPEVNRDLLSTLKAGDTIEGTITGIAQFGAFVDIGVGKDGLVHVSELAEGRVDKPEDAVQVGDKYTFKILEVDPEGTRISLSLRKAMRTQKLQTLEPGTIMDGTVSGLAPFGAFVDIGVGRDGLVHISELSEQRVGKVEDAVKPGDKVQVRVLEVDPQSKRISLTMRLEDRPRVREDEGASTGAPSQPSNVVPRTGPGAAARFANVSTGRDEGDRRGGRGRSENRDRDRDRDRNRVRTPQAPTEAYASAGAEEEEFEGNATLEDLLSKFGGASRNKERRYQNDEEDEGSEDRQSRRQRDAIRRTLQSVGDDE